MQSQSGVQVVRTVEQQIAEFMGDELDAPTVPITNAYVICSSPRVGSNMLTQYLRDTGGGGMPYEYFNKYALDAYRFRFDNIPILRDEYLQFLRSHRSPEGVFSANLHYHQIVGFFPNEGEPARFLESFSKIIVLERKDKVMQAISNFRAAKSGVWFADDLQHASFARSIADNYNSAGIAHSLAFVLEEQEGWRRILVAVTRPILRVFYEDMVEDLNKSKNRIIEFLGIRPGHKQSTSHATVQVGDGRNTEWRTRFLRDVQGVSPQP